MLEGDPKQLHRGIWESATPSSPLLRFTLPYKAKCKARRHRVPFFEPFL